MAILVLNNKKKYIELTIFCTLASVIGGSVGWLLGYVIGEEIEELLTIIPWIKDDLRDRPNNRQEMFEIFKAELDNNKFNYLIVNGNQSKRLKMAIKFIDNYIYKLNKNH